MMLCEFNYNTEVLVPPDLSNITNSTNISELYETTNIIKNDIVEDEESIVIVTAKPSFLQYLIIFWVFTFLCEEIRQVLYKLLSLK
jgi:hypothetical protein